MWRRPFPWLDTTTLFLGESQAILVDQGAEGEVRSETGEKGFFINVTTVLPASGAVVVPAKTILGSAGELSAARGCQNGQDGKTAA